MFVNFTSVKKQDSACKHSIYENTPYFLVTCQGCSVFESFMSKRLESQRKSETSCDPICLLFIHNRQVKIVCI
jgi:hypothetical protein